MTFHPFLIFLCGLVVIILGAEFVLRGASKIAARLGIKPILIGLTVVSVGTSMPELAVGITAVKEGMGSLAVGNIAGTNMINILFILGLSAAIRPLPLQQMSIRLDMPVMIAASLILIIMALDGNLNRIDGAILVVASLIYTAALISVSKRESKKMKNQFEEEFSKDVLLKESGAGAWVRNTGMLVFGIGFSILGANLLVDGSVSIARSLGISDAIIGLTIVAIGTSAPELVTTILATIKNDRDVAVGNLIGSSITNILFILGLTCFFAPNGIEVGTDILWIDLPLAAAVAIACYPVFKTDRMVSRKEGIIFVTIYLLYMAVLLIYRT